MKNQAEAKEVIRKMARMRGRSPGFQKKLQDASGLEPLAMLPPGQRIAPGDSGELIIHVDSLRMFANGEFNSKDPIIRIIIDNVIVHCHEVEIEGPSWLAEDYDNPLHDRPNAICLLKTKFPVKVIR